MDYIKSAINRVLTEGDNTAEDNIVNMALSGGSDEYVMSDDEADQYASEVDALSDTESVDDGSDFGDTPAANYFVDADDNDEEVEDDSPMDDGYEVSVDEIPDGDDDDPFLGESARLNESMDYIVNAKSPRGGVSTLDIDTLREAIEYTLSEESLIQNLNEGIDIKGAISSAWNKFIEFLKKIGEKIANFIGGIVQFFKNLFNKDKQTIKDAEKKYAELKKEFDEYKSKTDSEISSLKSDKDKTDAENRKLRADNASLAADNQSLRNKADKRKAALKELEDSKFYIFEKEPSRITEDFNGIIKSGISIKKGYMSSIMLDNIIDGDMSDDKNEIINYLLSPVLVQAINNSSSTNYLSKISTYIQQMYFNGKTISQMEESDKYAIDTKYAQTSFNFAEIRKQYEHLMEFINNFDYLQKGFRRAFDSASTYISRRKIGKEEGDNGEIITKEKIDRAYKVVSIHSNILITIFNTIFKCTKFERNVLIYPMGKIASLAMDALLDNS